MTLDLRNYLTVTGGYWAFTLTDGALRMLVVLYFHQLGYSPFQVAMLFLFYEFFGIVTNLVGGWLAARLGLNVTMHIGMVMQIAALGMLLPTAWLSVPYVMFAQALSGIAKDLNKMSAKASVKTLVPQGADVRLFKWVALLTGSKNALKGLGFFLGAVLLQMVGFQYALLVLAGGLFVVTLVTLLLLPDELGKAKAKPKFTQVFSNNAAINGLSAARFFLFGARDVWFVVAVPVFMFAVLGWSFMQVGGFMALWVVGYGVVQASAPVLLGLKTHAPGAKEARFWALMLLLIPLAMALALGQGWDAGTVLVVGLLVFGVVFAINSALHSYLILAYADHDKVALKVGFYYMANAGGRLAGTVLSGWSYQQYGLEGCLWLSAGFVLAALLLSLRLPAVQA
ncbi:organoarsenical effux MFS transporter ArsJ [Thiothrix lacustris]|uniref:Organoarsenical effux MFS transporter ArsJ n=1 Tax=Thiothrix lacustris TaxID=525917 RepID=A0ABY9MSK1_9GAMM|nr:organoarsenical effux MFS transporter ArsJ [Thiothrix lacustris]WML91402.1 organoarsenical effux MFS transporter ArsJ [Thiothrix lacustris]WMP16752.1 organoarsenical effux MFS transporter ArsJ [Thiothrix lacustris]